MAHKSSLPPRRGRPPAGESKNPPKSVPRVQSLTRGLSVLATLAGADGGLTLSAISRDCGLPASTAHRLLATLQSMGYVYQAEELGRWHVGLQAFRVGNAFLANRDFVAHSHAYLRRLMEQSGETANLAILDGASAVFLTQVQCQEIMRILIKIGSRVPLHASGVGKAIFAALPDDQIETILQTHGLPKLTAHTITSPEVMRAALKTIRQRGYSFDDEEHAVGTRCVAATVYDEHAEALGAISLAGPVARLPDERIKSLGLLVAHTAHEVSLRMGGRWPHPY
jgi:IclR family acetate operon transcriptional repressor